MEAVMDKINIEKYPAYKYSGVEWLDEIPEHWDCIRMKHLFRDVSIKNRPDAELLSVTQDQGVVPRTWVENRMVMPSGNLDSFKHIEKGDFAISLRSFEGGLEFCHHDGIISPAYTVLKAQREIENRYYKYLFKSHSFISEIQTSVVGIREGKNISYEELSYSLIPIPSLDEQIAIANFLDRKTAQIDKAIAQKEKLIELLKERRQILIHKAVTRGLDPNVKMKDSGVEWIGEVPEHWEVGRFKSYIKLRHGYQFRDNDFTSEGIKVVKITQLHKEGFLDLSKANTVSANRLNEFRDILIKQGDILMCLTGGTIGKIIRVSEVNEPLFQNYRVGHFSAVYPACMDSDYLFYLLSSNVIADQIFLDMSETGQPNIGMEDMNRMIVCIPPFSEQIAISKFINKANDKIANAIFLKEREIEKLKEYKATLINATVTGKIKVS